MSTTTVGWRYVTPRFQTFIENIALTSAQIADGVTKYKGVVSCLNAAYRGCQSDSENAFYIGSWAKKTCIRPPRDVDLYFLLPRPVYERFQAYSPGINRQSALLQDVRSHLAGRFYSSRIKGDGPVVLIDFESYSVEVVPAFAVGDREFVVCDTKNGGRYIATRPLHEIDSIDCADLSSEGKVRHLIRMLKCWQAYCSVPIKSFYLELLVIEFMSQWAYRDRGWFWYDWMCRDFFAWMISKAKSSVIAPGTYEVIGLGDAWMSRAQSAYSRALKACEFETSNDCTNAGDEWQKIFGLDIPKWI